MPEPSFTITAPNKEEIPFLLSVPHCGTAFPSELKEDFVEELAAAPDDTDWHLDRLYDFAAELGITTICPKYSRWVIDLNREPSSKPLYDDGRIITALCPVTDFNGRSIYVDGRTAISVEEISRRNAVYFEPYHHKIDEILTGFVEKFGIALFWDGHSIRRLVPTIQPEPFPDFILGNNDGVTADSRFIDVALKALNSGDFDVSHNTPFKGGYLTRSKGRPESGIHALQLEMSKDLYMSDNETAYSESKAQPVKTHLRGVFEALIAELKRET